MMARRAANPSGFTLLEVLATLVLMGIVLPVAMKGVSLATLAAGSAKRDMEAASLAEMKLNELVATGQWNNATLSGDFGADWPDYRWTAQSSERDTSTQELTVQVLWTARNAERSMSLTTLVFTAATSEGTTP